MGYEIIADQKGATIYNNTNGETFGPIISHPQFPRIEREHRQFAEEVMEECGSMRNTSEEELREAIATVRDRYMD